MRLSSVLAVACLTVSCASTQGGQTGEEQTTHSQGTSDPALQQALVTRWNDAVDAVGTPIDFHWPSFDKFPHPTFKEGTADAYQQFAAILLEFFRQDFAFLEAEHLFQTDIHYDLPAGEDLHTTFQKLATDFSSPTAFGNIPESSRQEVKGFLDRM
jgi:hypothetical protein